MNKTSSPPNLALPTRLNRTTGTYVPPWPPTRPGAMDYAKCPSLHMGKRREFRSEAAL